MGNKMKKLLLSLLLMPGLVIAQQLNHSIKTSEETDGVRLTTHTTSVVSKDWGVGISNTEYQTPTYNKTASGLLLISNYRKPTHSILGQIGVGTTSGKTYLLGDITGTYNLNKNLVLNAGLFGDLLDSTNSLANNITVQGLNLGADINYEKFSMAVGSKTVWYRNNNRQQGYYVKPFYSVFDGVSVYLTKRHYTNSQPFNGLYFSPDVYDRSGFGIGVRQRFGQTTVSGFVEKTKIKTQFSNDATTAWKLEITSPVNNRVKSKVTAGQDYNNGFNYRYLEVAVSYEF